MALRPRRADAQRNIDAIVGAGRVLLSERPDASMEDVAAAAGVARQTVYAHFASREALIRALRAAAAREALAAIDAAGLAARPPAEALSQFFDVGSQLIHRYPLLLESVVTTPAGHDGRDLYEPITELLENLISRGQESGDFDCSLSPTWLATAILGMDHAARDEVRAGRMTVAGAASALRESALRICGARTAATGAPPSQDAPEQRRPARPAGDRRRRTVQVCSELGIPAIDVLHD
jgi:AcrR family transcriptional regulator